MKIGIAFLCALAFSVSASAASRIPKEELAQVVSAFSRSESEFRDGIFTIKKSGGGIVPLFERAAAVVKRGHVKKVVIDGPCYSACVVFADQVRSHVCMTPRAEFGFHMGRQSQPYPAALGGVRVEQTYFTVKHSSDIHAFVVEHGGYPYDDLRTFTAEKMTRFWKWCK